MIKYKRLRNIVVALNKRCRKDFFDNLENKINSKPFWSTCEPYFSNKYAKVDADILLIENGKVLHDNRGVANVFNNYFHSSLKTYSYFNGKKIRTLTFLIKRT